MGRRQFDISQCDVRKIDKDKYECERCHYIISGGATRIRAHSEGIQGKGVKPCPFAKKIFQAASVNVSNKRAKTVVNAREQGNTQFIQFLQLFYFYFYFNNHCILLF